MNKIIWFIVILLIALILEIGLLGRFAPNLDLSLFLPLIFIISLVFSFEESLVLAGLFGFFLDVSSLQRFPFWFIFLILEVVIIYVSNKKFVDFSSNLSIFLGLFILCLTCLVFLLIISNMPIFTLANLLVLSSNFLLSSILIIFWIILKDKITFLTNEKGLKGL